MLGHCPVTAIARIRVVSPSDRTSVPSAASAAAGHRRPSCSAQPSAGSAVGYVRRTSCSGAPATSNALARAPEVPTSIATRTSAPRSGARGAKRDGSLGTLGLLIGLAR